MQKYWEGVVIIFIGCVRISSLLECLQSECFVQLTVK